MDGVVIYLEKWCSCQACFRRIILVSKTCKRASYTTASIKSVHDYEIARLAIIEAESLFNCRYQQVTFARSYGTYNAANSIMHQWETRRIKMSVSHSA
jgi:hypothetical protein